MEQLIKVSINEQGSRVVSARELYEFLEVKSKFIDWIKNRIKKYGFVENQDFVTLSKNLENGGKEIDYALTIDMAKELAMVQGNNKGKRARQYFIECERKLRQIAQTSPEQKRTQKYLKQGKEQKWVAQRIESVQTRNHFTSILAKHGVAGAGYQTCTNAIYTPFFGGSSAVVRKKKGIGAKANIRDNLNRTELAAINLAEQLASDKIENECLIGNADCEIACSTSSRSVAKAIMETRK